VIEEALAPDARWRAVGDGPWTCDGREEIREVMRRNLVRAGLRGRIEETVQERGRVLVAFRPEPTNDSPAPLDNGIAYMVVTFRDEMIVELKRCADRGSAESYLMTGDSPAPAVPILEGPGPPRDTAPEPPSQRVAGLSPFVHVEDVQRSIDFYHHLGFTLASVYKYRGVPTWAELESGDAKLMVCTDGDPVDPAGQGVQFYLYSHDLAALREQLVARGVDAGEIADGTPGPKEQVELVDPDGYVLMVAQID
jgi:hypothetical protein